MVSNVDIGLIVANIAAAVFIGFLVYQIWFKKPRGEPDSGDKCG